MTEVWVGKAIVKKHARPEFIRAVGKHEKWSLRRDLRLVLLRSPHTPLAQAIAFAQSLPTHVVRDVLSQSQLPENIKTYINGMLERRNIHHRAAEPPRPQS